MSESVEQAARVAGWKARADREAAAIIHEAMPALPDWNPWTLTYESMQTLVAIGWLQGASFGAHDTLDKIDQAFGLAKDEL